MQLHPAVEALLFICTTQLHRTLHLPEGAGVVSARTIRGVPCGRLCRPAQGQRSWPGDGARGAGDEPAAAGDRPVHGAVRARCAARPTNAAHKSPMERTPQAGAQKSSMGMLMHWRTSVSCGSMALTCRQNAGVVAS